MAGKMETAVSDGVIRVRGAREHNLKGVDVDIPRDAITAISGPSGSGKSSLAFDTLYAEGQRRYVESLSSYARQFLERMERPDVDSIEGLLPAIAIGRASPTTTARSTVGTVTEVADVLRVLFARFGEAACVACGAPVRPLDPGAAAAEILAAFGAGRRVVVAAPPGAPPAALAADGYTRALLPDGSLAPLEGLDAWPEGARLVVDRVAVPADPDAARTRLAEAVAAAYAAGGGTAEALPEGDPAARRRFTDRFACAACGRAAEPPTPLLFSFNSPAGACPECKGFGDVLAYDLDRCIPEPGRSLERGALDPFSRPAHRMHHRKMLEWCRGRGIPVDVPWRDLPEESRRRVLDGERRRGETPGFVGLMPFLRRLERKQYRPHIRFFLRRYRSARLCGTCKGARLRPEALAVRLGGRTVAEVLAMEVPGALAWLDGLGLGDARRARRAGAERADAAELLAGEVRSRLRTLVELGLEYLTLDRLTRTLSGGEAERIHLAAALATRLVETLYVLDEPTVGLHPCDTERLLAALRDLADLGNAVVVVEHDPDVVRAADRVIDLGPGAGAAGGEVVAAGTPAEVARGKSPTAPYLRRGRRPVAATRPAALLDLARGGGEVVLRGCRTNNLKGIDVSIPLGALTVVTGVSGSGKSSLVLETLVPAVESALGGAPERMGAFDRLEGAVLLSGVEAIDQSPVHRSSRSNPATYVGAFDGVRAAFAATPEARRRGWTPGHFSFNVRGGRCEACEGEGTVRVEMIFLADILVPCEACGGRRFSAEALEVRFKDLSIADALDLTVDEARDAFRAHPKATAPLRLLSELGLGYLRLGQPLPTLSGGEAQRLKLASALLEPPAPRRPGGPTRVLFVLDEPTTGLHPAEVEVLLGALRRLTDAGHAVVVVEHHMAVAAAADHLVDLGPGAGRAGGEVVYEGPPSGLPASSSQTGRFLREYLPS